MSETTMKFKRKGTLLSRAEIEGFYRTKYFSLFMNAYKFKGLNEQQERFLLTQFWEIGSINAFILEGSKPESIAIKGEESPQGELILTPYAPSMYNIYNYPTRVRAVRLRGASFIPQTDMKVNEDCVLGWAHTSHNPVRTIVEFYVKKITDVEMTIRTHLFVQKLPRLIKCTPENEARVKQLMNDIEAGENRIYLTSDDIKDIESVLESGGTYVIDKLYSYKLNLEKELMTIMGIDNIGFVKRERENNDEINANNEEIDNGGDCFLDEMKKFTKGVTEILGYDLDVEEKQPRVEFVEQGIENQQGDQNNED